MIYGSRHSSRAQKATLLICETILAAAALWMLLAGGLQAVSSWFGLAPMVAPQFRRLVLFLFVAVTYVRMTLMMTVLLKRSIGWEEAAGVCLAFALYYVIFSLLGGRRAVGFGAPDAAGIALFLAGAALNSTSELLRHRWRTNPRNEGKLYTGGLFRLSRHINYFGDVLWVSGWALFTRNPWSAIIPAALFCFFAFYNAPALDKHLAEKHGAEFEAYRRRTKSLVPFIF